MEQTLEIRHDLGAYSQDSYDPGLVVLVTNLLHQVDSLHCLELLSIDKEDRASGRGVKVMLQRKHPSVQSHSTPGTRPDTWDCHGKTQARTVRVVRGEWSSPFSEAKAQKARKGNQGPHPSVRIFFRDHFSVQFSSVAQSCLILFDPMDCSKPGFPVHHQLPGLTQTHVHRVSDAIQPSHPLSSPSPPPSIFPSIRVFSNESVLRIRWPKYWSFSFSISPSNEYSGLISFRMAWLDLLAVQGILKSLLQHHSSKASILQCSAFHIHT